MEFLTAAPVYGWLLLATVAAAIVAMHRLRPPAGIRPMGSTLLWESAARRAGVLRSPWRWWLGLLLSLAVGVALTTLLTRPGWQGAAAGTERIVLVVDVSPSMGARTRDGGTRWTHAVDTALGIIRRATGPVLVLDTAGELPSGTFLRGAEAEALVHRLRPSPVKAGVMPSLPAMAGLRVHVVSDGVERFDVPAGAVVDSVHEPADNVAVLRVAVESSPASPLRVDALVQLFNGSAVEKTVRVTLRGTDGTTLRQHVRMAPGERVDATFDVSNFGAGALAADAWTEGDSLPLDDIAFAVVPDHRPRRVLLVGADDDALADSLRALPGVQVRSIASQKYREDVQADLLVFEGFAPRHPPAVPALLFRPAAVAWLPAAGARAGPTQVAGRLPGDPLSDAVPWNGLDIRRAAVWGRLPEGTVTFAGGQDGALVIAGRARAPWIAAGFRPADTRLVFEPAFPAFLGHAITRLTGSVSPLTAALGRVRVALDDAQVTDGKGEPVPARAVPGGTLFDAVRADIYTVRSGGTRILVAASAGDVSFSDLNLTRFAQAGPRAESGAAPAQDPWRVLLLLVIAVLIADWFAHTRRITR